MKVNNFIAIAGSVVFALSSVAFGSSAEQRLAAMEQEIAQLKGQQNQSWLNERRAEEVKALVREVLQDAETRASLLENGMYAGHDGHHFFLKSADGGFLLNISGQIQLRHVANFRDGQRSASSPATGDDDHERGFEVRRAKIQFSGHIADPRIKYAIRLAVDRGDNSVSADKITIGYQLTDSIYVWGGEDKGPFLREELTSSSKQLAVDRSYINEIFTLDKVQGVGLKWHDASVFNDSLKAEFMVNDGLRSGDGSTDVNLFSQGADAQGGSARSTSKKFYEDATDIAITGRVDLRLQGDWAQAKDFTSWPGEDQAIFVGGAVHWEEGETGDAFLNNDFFSWTIDASYENNGFNAFVSFTGMHTDNEAGATLGDQDLYGLVLQAGYNMPVGDDSIEPFARWEYIDFDTAATTIAGSGYEDEVNIITFGVNYYFSKHNAKFTLDLVWALDPIPFSESGLGLLADASDEEDQFVIRSQFQLLF